jgi:hypothetical protein
MKREAEESASRGYSFCDKSVCPDHVDDAVLKELIREYASEESCSYCGKLGTEDAPIRSHALGSSDGGSAQEGRSRSAAGESKIP